MNQKILEKRKALQTISHSVQELAENDGLNPEDYKVNELLMHYLYNPDNEFTFKSFKGWKDEGYTVRKGVKAFIVWGQPINRTRVHPDGTTTPAKDDEQSEPPFFPLAFLFRSDQVVKPLRQARTKVQVQPPEVLEPLYNIDL